jgi:hypothetical protein
VEEGKDGGSSVMQSPEDGRVTVSFDNGAPEEVPRHWHGRWPLGMAAGRFSDGILVVWPVCSAERGSTVLLSVLHALMTRASAEQDSCIQCYVRYLL